MEGSEEDLCTICMHNAKNATLICMHRLCADCILKLPMKNCPFCRTPFTDFAVDGVGRRHIVRPKQDIWKLVFGALNSFVFWVCLFGFWVLFGVCLGWDWFVWVLFLFVWVWVCFGLFGFVTHSLGL